MSLLPTFAHVALLAKVGIVSFVLLELAWVVWRWPRAGWVVLGATVVTVAAYPAPPGRFLDAIWLTLLIATVPRIGVVLRAIRGYYPLLAVLGAMIAISVVTGVETFGFSQAFNEFRTTWMLAVGTAWVLSQAERQSLETDVRWFFTWLGWALIGTAAVHVARHGLGGADSMILTGDGTEVSGRALIAGQALMLAAAAGYLFVQGRYALPFVAVVVVLLSQNRSVWVAGACMFAVIFLTGGGRTRFRWLAAAGVATFAALIALMIGLVPSSVLGELTHSYQSRLTLAGRTAGWAYLVDQQNALGAVTRMIGQPAGTGWARPERGGLVLYSPHNWYVTALLRVGLVGLLALLLLLGRAALRLWRAGDTARLACLVLLAVYCIPYGAQWYQAPLLALALMGPAPALGPDGGFARVRWSSRKPASNPCRRHAPSHSLAEATPAAPSPR